MRDETAKNNRQTAALISHDLTRNNELAFSSIRDLQFYHFQILKYFFLDFGYGRIDMNDTLYFMEKRCQFKKTGSVDQTRLQYRSEPSEHRTRVRNAKG